MTVVQVATYRAITQDEITPDPRIQFALEEAEGMIQDYLGRYLQHGVYTEQLQVWPDGFAYPAAIPVTSTPASALPERHDSATLYNCEPDDTSGTGFYESFPGQGRGIHRPVANPRRYETDYPLATITYEGGWTEATMPRLLIRRIVMLAKASLANTGTAGGMAGVVKAKTGDVSVEVRQGYVQGYMDDLVPGTTDTIKGWKVDRL